MQEGDTELGGLQIPHGNNVNPPTPTPGPQPAASAVPQNPQPVPQSSPQPTPQLSTPQSINQPVSQPVDQLFSQTFSPENHTTNQSVIDSQTPQPQTFEQQFQSQVQTSAQPTPDTDIMLHNNSKKKRTLIVLGFLLLTIAIIGIIAVYFVFQQNNEKEKNIADTQILLNRYSNYLLYGTESDEVVAENVTWNADKIKENIIGVEGGPNQGYFDNLLKKFNSFAQAYSGQPIKTDSDQDKSIASNNTISDERIQGCIRSLNALVEYVSVQNITKQDMINIYLSEGAEALKKKVNSNYQEFNSYENLQSLKEYKVTLASAISDLYDIYNTNNCIINNALTDSCIENIKSEDDVVNAAMALESASNSVDNTEWHIINDPVSISRMIYLTSMQLEE